MPGSGRFCRAASLDYDPEVLDRLCLTGALGWGRLSLHPAMLRDAAESSQRVVPTSVAPITFFVRDDADWMLSRHHASPGEDLKGLSDSVENSAGISPDARRLVLRRHRSRHAQVEI